MSRRFVLPLAGAVLLAGAAQPAAAAGPLSVKVDRATVSTKLGHKFAFRTTISSRGPSTASGLIAHLNVLSVRPSVYVDPEDWASHRTRYLAPIPAGGSSTIAWNLQAVNAGRFAVYVAVLSNDGRTLLGTSPSIRLAVAERKTLDAGGILPLVIGMPALLGLAWIGLRFRRRGTGRLHS